MVSCWSAPTTKHAYRLSWISLVLTLIAAIAGVSLYVETGSSLCIVFGLENCVDFLSSVVVLWRFFAPSSLTVEVEAKLRGREKRASIAISIILLLLGFGIFITAMDDFSRGQEDPNQLDAVVAISFFSFIIFGALAIVKFHYANRLESASLYKDGICSMIGTILSGALFVDTLIIRQVPTVWWIDPVVAMLCGVGSIAYGARSLIVARKRDNLPICSPRWWFLSHGDGGDERSGRAIGAEDFPMYADDETELKRTNIQHNNDPENEVV